MTRGQYTREEISSQPESWIKAIKVLRERQKAIREFSRLNDFL